jgi:hypothetical protein
MNILSCFSGYRSSLELFFLLKLFYIDISFFKYLPDLSRLLVKRKHLKLIHLLHWPYFLI